MGKIVRDIKKFKETLAILRKQGKKIVFTNGCFDLIHPGHVKTFKQAGKNGDVLIVGLNSDKSVRKIKGETRPVLDQNARAVVVSAMETVDYVIIFDEPTPYRLIKLLRPDCLIKGADWKKDEIVGNSLVKEIVRVKSVKNYSTSLIIKKILASSNGNKKSIQGT